MVDSLRSAVNGIAEKFAADPPPKNPQTPFDIDETEIVSFVLSQHRRAKDRRKVLELEWARNIAYLEGRHWLRIDTASGRLRDTFPIDDTLYAHTINHVRRVSLTVVNLSTQNKPDAQALPESNLDIDEQAAEEADAVLSYTEQRFAPLRLRSRATYWALMTGAGWRTPWWDKDATAEMQVPEGVTPEGFPRPAYVEPSARLGNACEEIVPSFEMYIDPQADCWERAQWVIRETVRPVNFLREHYGKKAEGISEDARSMDSVCSYAFPFFLDYRPDEQVKDGVRVMELWEKPSPKYKRGRRIVVAGGRVMDYGDNPYHNKPDKRCLPFVPTYFQDAVGHPYGLPLISDLIDPQDEYNRLWSKALSRIERAKAYIGVATVGDASPKFINETREMGILAYDPTEVPQGIPPYLVVPPPELVGELVAMCQALQDQIENLAGARPVAQGVAPGQLSGLAIDLLQQANNTQHDQLRENIEQAEAEMGDWIVYLFATKAGPAPRLLGLSDDNNPDQSRGGVRTLQALQNGGSCRVKVTPGSATARTPAAKRAFVIQLREMGVFGPFGPTPSDAVRSAILFVKSLNDAGSAKILRDLEQELAHMDAQMQAEQQAMMEQQQQEQQMQMEMMQMQQQDEAARMEAEQVSQSALKAQDAEIQSAARAEQADLDLQKDVASKVTAAVVSSAMPPEGGKTTGGKDVRRR